MNETVTIPAQFNGPPGSGNGGYAAGAFAEFLEGAVEVTLRSPPPLGQQMQVVREENGLVVRGGETLVGEVRPCTLSLDVPDCPDARAVRTAVRRFVEFKKDDFQRCFVCGAERAVGDGLCLRTGPIDGRKISRPNGYRTRTLPARMVSFRNEFFGARSIAQVSGRSSAIRVS